jgi:hypothetical protein
MKIIKYSIFLYFFFILASLSRLPSTKSQFYLIFDIKTLTDKISGDLFKVIFFPFEYSKKKNSMSFVENWKSIIFVFCKKKIIDSTLLRRRNNKMGLCKRKFVFLLLKKHTSKFCSHSHNFIQNKVHIGRRMLRITH